MSEVSIPAVIESLDAAVARLTEPGAPFELAQAVLRGYDYPIYASIPSNLGDYFDFMRKHGDAEFLVYQEQRLTYLETLELALGLAAKLAAEGVVYGDRIAIVSRNNPEWIIAFIAAVSMGAVAVPMNGWWTTDELDYAIDDSGAKWVVADAERVQRLTPLIDKYALSIIATDEEAAALIGAPTVKTWGLAGQSLDWVKPTVDPDDNATILYTSGSTGHPKGVLSTHRGVLSALYSWLLMGVASKQVPELAPSGSAGNSQPVGLLTVPLFHCTASHSAFMLSILPGRKLIIMYKWDVEEAMRLIELERINWMTGVPTMSAELQRAAQTTTRDLSSLAEVYAGGAARPADQVEKLAKTFKRSSPGLGYGLTETNALGAFNSGVLYLANPSSTGRAVPAVTQFKIIDSKGTSLPANEIGEVCMKSPANAVGYWNKPEATASAFVEGWFHTGDLGKLDEYGFLSIVDRIKDIIIRGGENISCIEVEAAICAHPLVLEAAVFGVPDDRLGEAVGAVIVLSEPMVEPLPELRVYLNNSLAAFKQPAYVWVHDGELPRTATGKIFKRELKQFYTDTLIAQR